MSFPTRKIGNTTFAAIGFGAMGYTTSPYTEEERFKFFDTVYANGCTHWDTADVYFDMEEMLGKWFKRTGKRNEIFLATKLGLGGGAGLEVSKADPEYVEEAINKALKTLDVDYIDLFYLHRSDPTVPIELTIRAMVKFVESGKIKHLGISECTEDTLRRAHAVHPMAALQVEYSAYVLDIEDEKTGILKTARELGIPIVAYAPLGRGLLTGKYKSRDDLPDDDWRRTIPRFSEKNFPNILKITDGIKEIGERHKATPSQVALAWLLEQGDDIMPIFGASRVKNMVENLGALQLKLTAEEVKEIREMSQKADVAHGGRYEDSMVEVMLADTPALQE